MSKREKEKAIRRKEARDNRGPHAKLRWLRMSPRKVRLVIDQIRGKDVEQALNVLDFSPKAAAVPVAKLLRSAVANAEVKGSFDLDRLFVELATVDEGPMWRRWRPRAMGRATRVRKRTSHITLELAERA
ncbi:MAG: 50S ribosomal protein L22 [Myxococcota bacterium]|nr:50S ribosomal protein L22 [Myxococcota bacterium]